MRIEHVGLWVTDLENMKSFYEKYFAAKSSSLYVNPKTKFESYFLTFEKGSRLEIMHKKFLAPHSHEALGYAHLAFALQDKAEVDAMVKTFMADGYPLLNGPRVTGDGYYEAVICDPEGNLIELTTE